MLRHRYARNQKIRFKDALARVSIDITQEDPLDKPWVLRGTESTFSMRNFLKSATAS